MDPKWTVTVSMHMEDAVGGWSLGHGTWVHLAVNENTGWGPSMVNFNYGMFYTQGWKWGIWSTQTPILPSGGTPDLYNAMTVSGTGLAVSLFSADNQRLTLVIRQTNWDGIKNDDYVGWQLDFVDNDDEKMP